MATTRKNAFKSPPPRLPRGVPSHFLPKLDPWFVELAQFFKEGSRHPIPDPKRINKASRNVGGKDSQPTHPVPAPLLPEWPGTLGEMLALVSKSGNPQLAEPLKVMEQGFSKEALATGLNEVLENAISLLKYHATLPELRWREMQGDKNAGRQVVETTDLYNRWMHELLPRGGVRFKTNVHHNLLMLFGLTGGLGRLTSKELTDFFDQFCPCGKMHTLEVLRRLRRKLLEVLERGVRASDGIAARRLDAGSH
jgi:hypothetical protein